MGDVKQAIVWFDKEGQSYKIDKYDTEVDLSEISDMKELIFARPSFLANSIPEDGRYKWVGTLEKKRTRIHAVTRAFNKIF